MGSRKNNIKFWTEDVVYKYLGSNPPSRGGRTVHDMDILTSLELAGSVIHESNIFNTKDLASSGTVPAGSIVHDSPDSEDATRIFALGHTVDLIFKPFSERFKPISPGELTIPWDTLPQCLREELPLPPKDFQLYDPVQKRWNWPLFTTSSSPLATASSPESEKLSTEQQLAHFFNAVVVAVDKKGLGTSGDGDGGILRHWMGDWSQKALAGSDYYRKPDLVLVDKGITSMNEVSWLSPKVIGEYTRESYQPAGRLGKTMDTKAYIMLVEQPWRRFVLGLSIANNNLRLHFYDRSGGTVSSPFNIHLYPDHLIYVLCALSLSCRGCLGFDLSMEISPPSAEQRGKLCFLTRSVPVPALHPPSPSDPVSSLSLPHSQPLPKHIPANIGTVSIGDTVYELVDILFSSPSYLGRGTVCYLARHDGASFVVKDQWVRKTPTRDVFNEIMIMQRLRHIEGVPKLHGHWIVQADNEDDSTERYRAAKWHTLMKAQRVHLRLVMTPHARPLTMFKSKKELVSCVKDILIVLEEAAEEGILHRDCSLNNMAIEDLPDGSSRGLLLDWEFGVEVNDRNRYSLGGTGTVPYMSANLLLQIYKITKSNVPEIQMRKSASMSHGYIEDKATVIHTHADDIESLFYVFIWIIIRYDGPLGRKRRFKKDETTILDRWIAAKGLDSAGDAKLAFLFSSVREDEVKEEVSPYFEDLFDLVRDWRQMVAKNIIPGSSPVTFSDVIPLFDPYLAAPTEEKPAEMALIIQDLISDHRDLTSTIQSTPSPTASPVTATESPITATESPITATESPVTATPSQSPEIVTVAIPPETTATSESPSPTSPDSVTSLEPTSDTESLYEKRLSEDVRSLDNPPVPKKRFRHV